MLASQPWESQVQAGLQPPSQPVVSRLAGTHMGTPENTKFILPVFVVLINQPPLKNTLEPWFLNLIHSWMPLKLTNTWKLNPFPHMSPPLSYWLMTADALTAKMAASHHHIINYLSRKDVTQNSSQELLRLCKYSLSHQSSKGAIIRSNKEEQTTYHQNVGDNNNT